MTKRLHVVLDDAELRTMQRLARQDNLTTDERVRRRLHEAAAIRSRPDAESKLAAIRKAYRHTSGGPAPEIHQMLDEIERGFSG